MFCVVKLVKWIYALLLFGVVRCKLLCIGEGVNCIIWGNWWVVINVLLGFVIIKMWLKVRLLIFVRVCVRLMLCIDLIGWIKSWINVVMVWFLNENKFLILWYDVFISYNV